MTTLREILAMPERENAEGWVIWIDPFTAVKLKYETYIELHRIVSNLSKKEVWRQLRAGTYNDFKVKLPDEWHAWAEGIADELRGQFTDILVRATRYFQYATLRPGQSRKDLALWITAEVAHEYRGLVFSLVDGRDISDAIWRMIEPRGDE